MVDTGASILFYFLLFFAAPFAALGCEIVRVTVLVVLTARQRCIELRETDIVVQERKKIFFQGKETEQKKKK